MVSPCFSHRFGINHTIEVLTLWEDNSVFTAQWVQQNKLHTKGKKELDSYLLHQMLFAPIWKYILSVAEVCLMNECDYRNRFIIKTFLLCSYLRVVFPLSQIRMMSVVYAIVFERMNIIPLFVIDVMELITGVALLLH